MPLYSYKCKAGHEFDMHVRLDLSNEPTRCTEQSDHTEPKSECWAAVERILTAPSRSFPGADSWRR